MDKNTQPGSASLTVELKDGRITLRHGTDHFVLRNALVADGAWEAVYTAIVGAIEGHRLSV